MARLTEDEANAIEYLDFDNLFGDDESANRIKRAENTMMELVRESELKVVFF